MAAGFSQMGNQTPKYGEGGTAYSKRFGAALAEVYAGESDADPGPLFRDLCLTHPTEVLELCDGQKTKAAQYH